MNPHIKFKFPDPERQRGVIVRASVLAGKKVLIVEDSGTVRSIISEALESEGCEVHTAINGLDAVAQIPQLLPDLITTDVVMPGMDGYELCNYIRAGNETSSFPEEVSQTPIIVITASDSYGTRERWFEFGAAEFILKPFKADELIHAAKKILIPDAAVKDLTVLIAEDNATLRNLISSIVSSLGVDVLTAENGQQALEIIQNHRNNIDLMLTDYEMPEMDGLELCKTARGLGFDQPIIFLTGLSDKSKILDAFNNGATDYLVKPFLKDELVARLKVHMENHVLRKEQELRADTLEDKVVSRNKDLVDSQAAALHVLASLAEYRDPETGKHTQRTQKYIEAMLDELIDIPEFQAQFGLDDVANIIHASILHDIGKIGTPDSILLKPGKLTDQEFEMMKFHALIGETALKSGEQSGFMAYAAEIAGSHHEKWDGSGYPRGLAGEDIPLSGRLMALADVYDALRTERVYKAEMPHEKAKQIILDGRGKHFDPLLTDLFLKLEDRFQEIARKYAD